MTWPFNDIHVTTAFVNPFTSDVIVETTGTHSVNRKGVVSLKYLHIGLLQAINCVEVVVFS